MFKTRGSGLLVSGGVAVIEDRAAACRERCGPPLLGHDFGRMWR